MREIKLELIEDIEISGVDSKDYPDFCDAYVESASWKDTGKKLTGDECIALTEEFPEVIGEMCFEHLVCEAEFNNER